jgi:hypothetical protein
MDSLIKLLAEAFSESGTESSRSITQQSAPLVNAFSTNLGMLIGKIRLDLLTNVLV